MMLQEKDKNGRRVVEMEQSNEMQIKMMFIESLNKLNMHAIDTNKE